MLATAQSLHPVKNYTLSGANTISKATGRFPLRIFPLIAGVIAAQKITLGGEFYAGEILAIIYFTLNLTKLKFARPIKALLFFGFFWATCQFVSDQVNHSDTLDSVKGIGAPLVFVLTLTSLSVFFYRNIQRMPSFLLGAFLGQIPGFVLFPDDYFLGNPWKWGIGQLVLGMFAIYYTFFISRPKKYYLIGFVSVFSIFSILHESRIMAIFPVMAVTVFLLLRRKGAAASLSIFKGRFAASKMLFIIFAFLLFINTAFTAIFSSEWVLGMLPEDSAKKFQTQASGEYGTLLGGRSEMLVSIGAFLDAPLLGHGSWAKDKNGYQDKLTTLKYAMGYSDKEDVTYKTDLIPIHSYLMGGLVWAGLGGGLFWGFISRWLLIQFIQNFSFLGFYFYNGIIGIFWDILFSPFGAIARWGSALFIASLYSYSIVTSRNRNLP